MIEVILLSSSINYERSNLNSSSCRQSLQYGFEKSLNLTTSASNLTFLK
ncbi:hypothetical protein [uncultured Campylobacter sp.]|nr:hypothetical protein [uncultured Campylobacter sp.]